MMMPPTRAPRSYKGQAQANFTAYDVIRCGRCLTDEVVRGCEGDSCLHLDSCLQVSKCHIVHAESAVCTVCTLL